MPTHFLATWHHEDPHDPIRLYEEVGDDRMELRKVEEFRDGRLVRADPIGDGPTSLSWVPVPNLAEIESQAEFTVQVLTLAQFDEVWERATDSII